MCLVDSVLRRGYLHKHQARPLKEELFCEQDIRCCFCNRLLTVETATIEHIVPKAQAEFVVRNHIDNLTFSCAKCNSDRVTAEFYEFRNYTKGLTDIPPVGCKREIRRHLISFVPTEMHKVICSKYKNGNTIVDICSETHIGKKTIRRILRENGLIISARKSKREWTINQYNGYFDSKLYFDNN